MGKKETQCPWCGEMVVPEPKVVQRKAAAVVERKCPACGKILAAYLEEDQNFMPKIRKF